MKKRIFSLVLAVLMLFIFNMGASAETLTQPRLDYSKDVIPGLSVSSSKQATCTVSIEGIPGTTTRIVTTMTLQKKGLLKWNDVTSWSFSVNTSYDEYTKRYGPLDSGTYRVYVECVFYAGTASETVTATCSSVKVS